MSDEKPVEDASADEIFPEDNDTPVRPAGRQGRFDAIPEPTRDNFIKKRVGG